MSLRNAIYLKCMDCIYDPEVEGGWKQQVSQCELTACPLWEYRPHPRTSSQSPKMTSNQCTFETISKDQGVWVSHSLNSVEVGGQKSFRTLMRILL